MKSISFSDEMMRALLDGRKTVMRRLMKRQPDTSMWKPESLNTPKEWRRQACLGPGHHTEPDMWCLFNVGDAAGAVPYTGRKSPYRPGETVYVKEAWGAIDLESGYALRYQPQSKDGVEVVYRVGCDDFTDSLVHKWFPPVTMPEWASRLKITFTGIWAERIQGITEDEAVKEGAEWRDYGLDRYGCFREGWAMDHPRPTEKCLPTARMAFANYWNRLYGGERWNLKPTSAWDRNERAWRYEFEVTK